MSRSSAPCSSSSVGSAWFTASAAPMISDSVAGRACDAIAIAWNSHASDHRNRFEEVISMAGTQTKSGVADDFWALLRRLWADDRSFVLLVKRLDSASAVLRIPTSPHRTPQWTPSTTLTPWMWIPCRHFPRSRSSNGRQITTGQINWHWTARLQRSSPPCSRLCTICSSRSIRSRPH